MRKEIITREEEKIIQEITYSMQNNKENKYFLKVQEVFNEVSTVTGVYGFEKYFEQYDKQLYEVLKKLDIDLLKIV